MNGVPMQFHWCYPIERTLKVVRMKCKNKCKIEASIAEAFILEEVSNFTTTYYRDDTPTLHNPVSRYNTCNPEDESKLSLFRGQLGPAGAKETKRLGQDEWASITLYVLLNLQEVRPYIK